MHARRACEGDSFMSSTVKRCIHSFQSSFVLVKDVSQAVLRCCWLTVNFAASAAGVAKSADLAFSIDLRRISRVRKRG